MENKVLGKTGVKVSELCLGTMTFGGDADKETSFRIMERFAEAGGNFLDTANVYNKGKSEEILGEWISGQEREDYFIATKVRFQTRDGPNSVGLSRKHILKSVNESLSRLRTDYIDLLQVHAWDPVTPIAETMKVLSNLVEQGTVRYIGASNFRAWQLALALQESRLNGYEEFVALQPQYNLLTRATEYELLPLCRTEKIGVLPWGPLKGGFLSGKYDRKSESVAEGTRISSHVKRGWGTPWDGNEKYVWGVVDAVRKVAFSTGKTPSQVALNWLLSNDAVTSPIIGARNVEQLEDNLGATGWKLAAASLAKLNHASSLYVTYPYDENSEKQQRSGRS